MGDISFLLDVVDKLNAVGVKLSVAPGEYIVNFRNGEPATEDRTDDLDDALAHGLAMGPAPVVPPPLGPMGKGNVSRWAMMYAHNRKLAARRRDQRKPKA